MTDVEERLAELVRETLALPRAQPMTADALLYADLGLTSMDLLDLIFRVEESFGLVIPRGTVATLVRGELDEDAFAAGGLLTPVGHAALAAFAGVEVGRLPAEVELASLPQHLNLRALARVVGHLDQKLTSK